MSCGTMNRDAAEQAAAFLIGDGGIQLAHAMV
jgi:hypothetical protein